MTTVEKANHAYAKCMLCKENPPDSDSLWQDSAGDLQRAWHCAKCFPSWYAEKGEMVIYTHRVDGAAPSRYRPIRHSPKEKRKVNKDTVLKVNDQRVTLGELAEAWLQYETAQKTITNIHRAAQDGVVSPEPEADLGQERIEKSWEVEIIKADKKRHTITSVVMQPDKRDAQKDTVTEEDIADAIEGYMMNARGAIDLLHKEILPPTKAVLVQIWQSPVAFEIEGRPIKKGAWLQSTKILDMELWSRIEKGEINAYSIKGWGKRTKV